MVDLKLPKGTAYEKYTWPEMRDLPKEDRVAIIPLGSVEEHGHHLPLDTDDLIPSSVCAEAARRAPGEIIVLPVVAYGTCEMNAEYSGTISITPETLVNYLFDIVKSLARHGFTKVLIVNGHGGNRASAIMTSRRATSQLGIACATVNTSGLIGKRLSELRVSEPGGMAHACEMETSYYLHLDKSSVQMDKAVKDIGYPPSEFFGLDFSKGGVASFTPVWATFSKTGTLGDPTVATAEKGEKWLDAAADRLVRLVREFKTLAQKSQKKA